MKFGKTLLKGQLPKWRHRYISYKHLKQLIRELVWQGSKRPRTVREEGAEEEGKEEGAPATDHPRRALRREGASEAEAFFEALRVERGRVASFYKRKAAYVELRGGVLARRYETLREADESGPAPALLPTVLSMQRALEWFRAELVELNHYCHLNAEGFRKILKKFAKNVALSGSSALRLSTDQLRPAWEESLAREGFLRAHLPGGALALALARVDDMSAHLASLVLPQSGVLASLMRRLQSDRRHPLTHAQLRSAALDNERLLHHAVRLNMVEAVRELAPAVEDVDAMDDQECTALARACCNGLAEVALVLLDHGASVDAQDRQLRTALHLTALRGEADAVRLLLERGASHSVPDQDLRTPLHACAVRNRPECAELLLAAGADVDVADSGGLSALALAAASGHAEAARAVLDGGADVALFDWRGTTPLHHAAAAGHEELVRELLARGASVHSFDASGRSPLHEAALGGHAPVVRLLLEAAAAGGGGGGGGASGHEHAHDAADLDAWTPLHDAACSGSLESVAALLAAGANALLADRNEWTPRVYALYRGHLDVADALAAREKELGGSGGAVVGSPAVASPQQLLRTPSSSNLPASGSALSPLAAAARPLPEAEAAAGSPPLARQADPAAPPVAVEPQHRSAGGAGGVVVGTCRVEFRVKATTTEDQYLSVIGDSEALGVWNPLRGRRMATQSVPGGVGGSPDPGKSMAGLSGTPRSGGAEASEIVRMLQGGGGRTGPREVDSFNDDGDDDGDDEAVDEAARASTWVLTVDLPVYAPAVAGDGVSPREAASGGPDHPDGVAAPRPAPEAEWSWADRVARMKRPGSPAPAVPVATPSPPAGRDPTPPAPATVVSYKYIVRSHERDMLDSWEVLPYNRVVTLVPGGHVMVDDGVFGTRPRAVPAPFACRRARTIAAAPGAASDSAPDDTGMSEFEGGGGGDGDGDGDDDDADHNGGSGSDGKKSGTTETWLAEGWLVDEARLQVTLGHVTEKRKRPPVTWYGSSPVERIVVRCGERQRVGGRWVGAQRKTVELPPHDPLQTLAFHVPQRHARRHMHLQFEVYGAVGLSRARAHVLPRQLLGAQEGALTVPLVDADSQLLVGEVSFQFTVVHPFKHPLMSSALGRTFSRATRVIGHRGAGAENSAGDGAQGHPRRSHIAENTILSFVTAGLLGAEFVEMDIQLTRDHVPVVYHNWDFRAPGSTLSTPVSNLTLAQFKRARVKRRERSLSIGSARELAAHPREVGLGAELGLDGHGAGGGADETGVLTAQELEEGVAGLRASIRDEIVTLVEALRRVPVRTGFNIEIKYPSSEEQAENALHPVGRNEFVDRILTTVFEDAGERPIMFSSFDPDICLMASLKQPRYPVFFLTSSGDEKTVDPRRNSLREAVRFARSANLLGIVAWSRPLVQAPEIITNIRSSGLLLCTWGADNNDRGLVELQKRYGVDSIISDHVAHISGAGRG